MLFEQPRACTACTLVPAETEAAVIASIASSPSTASAFSTDDPRPATVSRGVDTSRALCRVDTWVEAEGSLPLVEPSELLAAAVAIPPPALLALSATMAAAVASSPSTATAFSNELARPPLLLSATMAAAVASSPSTPTAFSNELARPPRPLSATKAAAVASLPSNATAFSNEMIAWSGERTTSEPRETTLADLSCLGDTASLGVGRSTS
eukprot:scaffold21642_cov63-Phaeocystis_antarctica.AAC.4